MGLTLSGSSQPIKYAPPIVEIKDNWAEPWSYRPEIQLLHLSIHTAGSGRDSAILRREYGYLCWPWESSASYKGPLSLDGRWVRVSISMGDSTQTVFVGKIFGDGKDLDGASNGPQGIQQWQVYGPLFLLERIHISSSWWYQKEADPVELGWLPPMNDRYHNALRGNAIEGSPTWLYDGTRTLFGDQNVWDHYQYAQYLLYWFVSDAQGTGPQWSLGGQADLLSSLTDTHDWGPSATAAQILRQLIPVARGVDYRIVPMDDGFEINIFTLTSQPYTVGSKTLQANPRTINYTASRDPSEAAVRISRTEEHGYKWLRVIGGRIVICCSIHGDDLTGRWPLALEMKYQYGDTKEGATAEDHDRSRQRPIYRDIFRRWGAVDMWQHPQLYVTQDGKPTIGGDTQRGLRRTLDWTPILSNTDYQSGSGPDDNNEEGTEATFQPPMAIIRVDDPATPFKPKFYSAPQLGLHIRPCRTDWGLEIMAHPNHLLAAGRWVKDAATTLTEPKYDGSKLELTFAFESDDRLDLIVSIPNAQPSDGELCIHVPGAELWAIMPGTLVGIDEDGTPQWISDLKIVRNDHGILQQAAAGAVARYLAGRMRATIEQRGLMPWQGLLGTIVTNVQEGTVLTQINAPITSVEWLPAAGRDGLPMTRCGVGYAQ